MPVAEGDPPIELTESATITIPSNDPSSGIAIWAKSTTSGIAIVLGLISNGTTVPTDPVDPPTDPVDPPTDPVDPPTDPVDLSGTNTVYGSPGTIFPLGIYLAGSTASYSIAYPTGFPLKVARQSNVIVPVASQWTTPSTGYPYSVTGQAVSSSTKLKVVGTGITASNGNIKLAKGTYLQSDPLALDFPKTADDATTQTPAKFRLSFKGVIPNHSTPPIVSLYDYGIGRFEFGPHWDGSTMFVHCGRGNTSTETKIISDAGAARALGTNQLYECEYNDNPGGTGGLQRCASRGIHKGPHGSRLAHLDPREAHHRTLEWRHVGQRRQRELHLPNLDPGTDQRSQRQRSKPAQDLRGSRDGTRRKRRPKLGYVQVRREHLRQGWSGHGPAARRTFPAYQHGQEFSGSYAS